MKKLMVLSIMLGTMIFVVPSAEAKGTVASIASQDIIIQPVRRNRGRWNRRPTRVMTTTRTTWINGVRYRETLRTTYFANGRTRTVVTSRVRLGGRRYNRIIRNY